MGRAKNRPHYNQIGNNSENIRYNTKSLCFKNTLALKSAAANNRSDEKGEGAQTTQHTLMHASLYIPCPGHQLPSTIVSAKAGSR